MSEPIADLARVGVALEATYKLDGAIGLVVAFNTDRVDSRTLCAVTTLLHVTKARVDCHLAELQLVVTA